MPGLGAIRRDPERLGQLGEFLRIHQDNHDSTTSIARPRESPAPVRAASLRDPATTGPRRPPRYRIPLTFPSTEPRKMRPADLCKPELSKTSTRASGAYPACRVMNPTHGMRCAVHAVATSFGPPRGTTSSFVGHRSLLRLASGAPSPYASAPRDRAVRPRSLPSPPRERRRTPRPEAPSTDKRALASSRSPRRRCRRRDVPGNPSTESHEGSRARSSTRAQPQPRAPTSIGRPSAGICKQPEARARPAKRPNLARAEAFSAPTRCPTEGLRAAKHPGEPGWRPEGAGLASRRTGQPACAQGTEAN